MRKFTHVTATSLAEVIPLLDHRTRPLAGGTDLVTQLKDHLISPDRLVSLRGLGLRGVAVRAGRLYIGALTTLSELERDPQLRSDPYRALAQAAHSAASPQLRNVATIGGNLLQDVRCPYYRGPFTCWLKGGTDCYARNGEHHIHALFQQSPCIAAHPSDPVTALLALDATVTLAGRDGERSVDLLELLVPPTDERRTLNTLGQAELITNITLPARDGWRSTYQKAMERAVYAFALAGVAAAIKVEQGKVAAARIALGGIANTPLPASDAAASLIGKPLTDESIATAAALAVRGARPLPQTTYKEELVVRLVRAALMELSM
jgi:xanthine dehydrogenase YagS FAD-binding subunit